jgi:hypothetical protein
LPHEVIGEQGVYGYVEPAIGDQWTDAVRLRDRSWDPDVIRHMVRLHRPDVMTPVLGWMAAAPLRSLCRHFPPLALTGAAGNGKTTITGAALQTFGFWVKTPMTIAGTTPHGVTGFCASTNAFPVWFDEYRANSARPETKMAVDQVLRDSWDGGRSIKGGGNQNNVMELGDLPARAPLIVTGEDTFSETSHLERVILIKLPKAGRNSEALDALAELGADGLGRAYVEWLLDRLPDLHPPVVTESRQAQGRAIVRWGYDLLEQFLLEHDVDILPPYDDSRVKSDADEAAKTNPFDEAVEAGQDAVDAKGLPVAWIGDGFQCVRPGELCAWIARNRTDIRLPGGKQALTAFIKDEHGAQFHDARRNGARTKMWRWPVDDPHDPHLPRI